MPMALEKLVRNAFARTFGGIATAMLVAACGGGNGGEITPPVQVEAKVVPTSTALQAVQINDQ
jgi:hypothetical protein